MRRSAASAYDFEDGGALRFEEAACSPLRAG